MPNYEQSVQDLFEWKLRRFAIPESTAHEIMEFIKHEIDVIGENIDIIGEPNIKWNMPSNRYGDIFYRGMFALIKPMVAEWTKKNRPGAHWIAIFEYTA